MICPDDYKLREAPLIESVSDRPEDDARKGQRHKDGYALKTWDARPGNKLLVRGNQNKDETEM